MNRDLRRQYWAMMASISQKSTVNGERFSAEAWADTLNVKFVGSERTPDGRRVGVRPDAFSELEFREFLRDIEGYAKEKLGIAEFGRREAP
jgi:hypothetical protein